MFDHPSSKTIQVNKKAAESLADPEEYPNLFEDWQVALGVESKVAETRFSLPYVFYLFFIFYDCYISLYFIVFMGCLMSESDSDSSIATISHILHVIWLFPVVFVLAHDWEVLVL